LPAGHRYRSITDTHAHTDTHADPQANTDAYTNTDPDAKSNTDAYADTFVPGRQRDSVAHRHTNFGGKRTIDRAVVECSRGNDMHGLELAQQ
jgi:hypothetical protein